MTRNLLTLKSKRIALSVLLITTLLVTFQIKAPRNNMLVQGATQEEAFESITKAFEKVEQASRESIDVSDYIASLNQALNMYHTGNYDGAYALAESVLEEVTENINNVRWGKVFPYVIIPINLVLIAGIIVFFGKNILGWFRRKKDEEYLDLEIVYETESEEKTATNNTKAATK